MKTLMVFTDGIPQRGSTQKVWFLVGEQIQDRPLTRLESLIQVLYLSFARRIIRQSENSPPLDPSKIGPIGDVIFIDVNTNRVYESPEQRKSFMELINV